MGEKLAREMQQLLSQQQHQQPQASESAGFGQHVRLTDTGAIVMRPAGVNDLSSKNTDRVSADGHIATGIGDANIAPQAIGSLKKHRVEMGLSTNKMIVTVRAVEDDKEYQSSGRNTQPRNNAEDSEKLESDRVFKAAAAAMAERSAQAKASRKDSVPQSTAGRGNVASRPGNRRGGGVQKPTNRGCGFGGGFGGRGGRGVFRRGSGDAQ